MAAVGCALVSTADQDPALQFDALPAAVCAKVFEDRNSGARGDRPGLRTALDYARDGDVLVTWKLDRLGRSLPHLTKTIAALERRGVGWVPLAHRGDRHHHAGGRLVFHLFAALGQFERDLIRSRRAPTLRLHAPASPPMSLGASVHGTQRPWRHAERRTREANRKVPGSSRSHASSQHWICGQ